MCAEFGRNELKVILLRSTCFIDRPAYMDEYEKLEEELQRIYDDYMLKFRNQTYLESIVDEYQKAELDANEASSLSFY